MNTPMNTMFATRLHLWKLGLLLCALTTCASTRAQAPAIRVATIHPTEKALLRVVEQPAQVEPYAVAPLYAKVAGYVDKVDAEIGQVVEKDKVLLTINSPELKADLKQKDALVLQAQSFVEQAEAAVAVSKAMQETATAQADELLALVEKAQADLARYKSELDRMNQLVSTNAVPAKVRDEVLNQFQAAEASVKATQAKAKTGTVMIAEAKSKLLAAEADERAAKAKLEVANAARDLAKVLLDYTEVRAPFAGEISLRAVDTGHLVSGTPGGTAKPLLTIVQADRLRISVDVPEVESGYLAAGNPVTIRFPALSNQAVTTTVTRVAAAIATDTRTLRAEIELPNTDGKFKPGLFAHALITVAAREKCLVLPTSAILTDTGKTYCMVVQKGAISRVPVDLGLRAGAEVEVLAGVTTADDIIPKNPANYTVGQAAEVLPPPATK
jgi:HlyD family secretion protein